MNKASASGASADPIEAAPLGRCCVIEGTSRKLQKNCRTSKIVLPNFYLERATDLLTPVLLPVMISLRSRYPLSQPLIARSFQLLWSLAPPLHRYELVLQGDSLSFLSSSGGAELQEARGMAGYSCCITSSD